MSRGKLRFLIAPALTLSVTAFSVGCGTEEGKPMDVAPKSPPPSVKPEDQPKGQRPAKGSSSGMNYNPAGPPPASGP